MPNNAIPIITKKALENKIKLADSKSVCKIDFHYGTDGRNTKTFSSAYNNKRVHGLKVYFNLTTGRMKIEDLGLLEEVFASWNTNKPILAHAENVELGIAVALAHLYGRRLHICHIARKEEVELVRKAKERGMSITAGVCPHHLFLSENDREKLGTLGMMLPALGSSADKKALWAGLLDRTIDIVETDHAPHSLEEKHSDNPPHGVPGLETALGLLLKAVKDKKMKFELVKEVLYDKPREIFNIAEQKNTYIEFDKDKSWVVGENGYESKCGWSPFEGWKLYGKPQTVVIKGKEVIKDGKIVEKND